MKTIRFRIIGLVICALSVTGFFFRSMPVSSSVQRLTDKCPQEKRSPVEKHPAGMTSNNYDLLVSHPKYGFSFTIPNDGFRFEENTLQEYEEPIYLPTYLYTMLLTFGQTRIESRLAPYEIRFIVYPSWCNTEEDWANFLQTTGWQLLQHKGNDSLFTVVGKVQSGRTYRRLFTHYDSNHYEFEESWDNTIDVTAASESARRIVESFVLIKKAGNE